MFLFHISCIHKTEGALSCVFFPNSEPIYGLLGSFVTLVFDQVLYLPFKGGISSSVDVLYLLIWDEPTVFILAYNNLRY